MTQVVSSISGLQVYAPSAGFAPTNSADVSAIASGYQVVSSTATQLYAGTAYLTSVNDTPVSASRAGNAANASLANSAYYDGTGRLISSLPDSATVSAIASSYAESAASGKQDTLAFAYDDDKISAINGSALAGQGGVTGDYVETSALEVSIGSANYIMSATSYAQQQASGNVLIQGKGNSAFGASLAQGRFNSATYSSFSQGNANNATGFSLAQGSGNKAYAGSFAQGYGNSASGYSVAQGDHNSAYNYSVAIGYYNSATDFATAFGINNLLGNGSTATGDSVALVIGDGHSKYSRHDLMVVTKDGEITMFSSTADTTGTGIMSSIRAISAAATGGGGVDSATVSAIASSYAESAASGKLDSSASSSFYTTANESGYVDSSYVEGQVSGKQDASAMSAYQLTADMSGYYTTANESGYVDSAYVDSQVSGKQDTLTFDWDADSAISSINGSALAGGGATGDYLTAVIGSDRARIATGFQNGNNNRPSLFISAEREAARSTWPRMILTDWNRTTGLNHSGMLLADGFEFYQCPDSAYGQVNPSGIKRARLDPTNLQFLVDTAISSDGHSANYGRSGLWFFPTGGSALSISISSDTSVGPFIQLNDNSGLSGKMMVSSIGYWDNKLDSTAFNSADFYTTANESGFVDSAYVDSAVSGKLDSSASSSFYTTANESGFLTGLPKNISVANLSASGHVRARATGQDLYGNFDYAGMYFRSGSQRPYNIGIDNTGSNFYIATAKNGFERIYASSIQSWNGKADSSALSSYVPYSSLEYNTASAISGINGSALAAGSTYSAGEGIDITDDVISVEAPVDIVAGPGIVIDNPDGNTLRVSQSTFGAWENITDQFTWESNVGDNGVRCLYNTTLKLLWMQGYVQLNVGTSLTKVCTLPSSMKTQVKLTELYMASTLEEKHGVLSTNDDRTELNFKWITAPSNKYVGFFLFCPMEEV